MNLNGARPAVSQGNQNVPAAIATVPRARCTRLHAASAAKALKSRFNPGAISPFIAAIASVKPDPADKNNLTMSHVRVG